MKETDTHTTPHITGRDGTREGHRQAPKHTSLLTDSSNQRLNTQRKCTDIPRSLGSEVTRVLFFIGLSVFLKFPKTNIYYINNRGEFKKKIFSSSTSSRNRSPAPNSLPHRLDQLGEESSTVSPILQGAMIHMCVFHHENGTATPPSSPRNQARMVSKVSFLDVTLCFKLLMNKVKLIMSCGGGEGRGENKLQFLKVLKKLDHRFNPTP